MASNIKIDSTFTAKTVVKNITEAQLELFVSLFLKNVWLSKDIPGDQRQAGGPKKLSLTMFPPKFNIEKMAQTAIKRGILGVDKIGVIPMNINAIIVFSKPYNCYIIEFNKIQFETDGDVQLLSILSQTIAEV